MRISKGIIIILAVVNMCGLVFSNDKNGENYAKLYASFDRVATKVKEVKSKTKGFEEKRIIEFKLNDINNILELTHKLDKLYTGVDLSSYAFLILAFNEVNAEVKKLQADTISKNKNIKLDLYNISCVVELVRYYEERAGLDRKKIINKKK